MLFRSNDTHLFLGRKRLIEGSEDPEGPKEGLLSKVSNHPLTVVLGPSGSGKSSLVKAGLIPALVKSEEKNNQEEWYVLNPVRPGDAPFDALARAILPIEIEKSKFHEIEQSEPGCKVRICVYFHPVGYVSICIDLQSQKYFVVQVLIRNLSVYKHFSANQGSFDL